MNYVITSRKNKNNGVGNEKKKKKREGNRLLLSIDYVRVEGASPIILKSLLSAFVVLSGDV